MFDEGFAAFVVGIILLIFMLSLLLNAVNGHQSERDGDTGECHAADQQTDNAGYEQLSGAIADAIHTYRRDRRADERNRSSRERATIVVLGVTAILALFAAASAIYSAVIFTRQARDFRDQEQRQLRAYLGPVFDSFTFKCPHCDAYIANPANGVPPPSAQEDAVFYKLKNYGTSPARRTEVCAQLLAIVPPETLYSKREHLFSLCDNRNIFNVTVWPGESRLEVSPAVSTMDMVAILQRRAIGVFVGRIVYDDIWGASHNTFICRAAYPGNPREGELFFTECPNTPGPQDD